MKKLEIQLTEGKKAVIRSLTARETMQATNYAGERPSALLVGQAVSICMVCELSAGEGSPTEAVSPLASVALFQNLGDRLTSDDLLLIGTAGAELSTLSDDQKKALTEMALATG